MKRCFLSLMITKQWKLKVGRARREFFHKKAAQKGGEAKKGKTNVVRYKCDKKGHYAHECRVGKEKKAANKKGVKCFNCDQIEHYRNQFKEPTKDGNGSVCIGTSYLKTNSRGERKSCVGR